MASKIKENLPKSSKSQIPIAKYTNVGMSPFCTICKLFSPQAGATLPGVCCLSLACQDWHIESLKEFTENHEEPEPEDLMDERERKDALDLTDRLDPQLEAGK